MPAASAPPPSPRPPIPRRRGRRTRGSGRAAVPDRVDDSADDVARPGDGEGDDHGVHEDHEVDLGRLEAVAEEAGADHPDPERKQPHEPPSEGAADAADDETGGEDRARGGPLP